MSTCWPSEDGNEHQLQWSGEVTRRCKVVPCYCYCHCPHMCYHAEFGRSRSNHMGVCGGSQTILARVTPPLRMRGGVDPQKHPPPHVSPCPVWSFYRSNGMSVSTEIHRENRPLASRPSRSLKVIENDTDRSAIYDFLLVIYGNQGPASYRFRDKWRFRSKNRKFPHPLHLTSPAKSSLWNFVTAVRFKKI